MTPPPSGAASRPRAERFTYAGYDVDASAGVLTCRYRLDDVEFTETVALEGVEAAAWEGPGVEAAIRFVVLFLGVSYYKAGAPPTVDLGGLPLLPGDVELLRQYYVDGLAEFAYCNGLDLAGPDITGLEITGREITGHAPATLAPGTPGGTSSLARPLVPFGGGIDSIVTTEIVRQRAGDESTALFVVSKSGQRYAAVEAPAALTGLTVLRAARRLDDRILASRELGYLNGHVPVTGMITAIAVLAALLHGRDAVILSNESSASSGNLVVGERVVNHQWSKGLAFEAAFRAALARHGVPVDCFSLLRSVSELWVAQRFAGLAPYHGVFRSCNRAFYVDPTLRLDHWCGECDKCCFIDLVLAPFLDRAELESIFGGHEPLADEDLVGRFRTLLGISSSPKPFDCVGDVPECRSALRLAARRSDRADSGLLQSLLTELPVEPDPSDELLRPGGPHFIPDAYAPGTLLV